MTKETPDGFAKKYLDRNSPVSILESALVRWYGSTTDDFVSNWRKTKTLDDLKNLRPDRIPRFVVIADGAVGLSVREYVQSPNYKGEISGVHFFNTPHEGTGFADQAILNGSRWLEKKSDNEKFAALIPLALVAYLAGGIDGLQEFVISLMKSTVMQMAYSAGEMKLALDSETLFGGLDSDNPASWYLAQDADERDSVYMDLVSEKAAGGILGSAQLLNSYSKNNAFKHPAYNVVYSYGMPSVGNGRRTLPDFIDQAKNHISQEKMKLILADSLGNILESTGIDDELNNLAGMLLENGNVSAALSEYGKFSGQAMQIASVVSGLSELRSVKLNKDDIPGSMYKLVRIVENFIPETYKSEVYSLFSKYFTPETREILKKAGECSVDAVSRKGCALAGLSVLADNLSDYALNFMDEGAYDVPFYSAVGENVAAFKEAGVARLGYEVNEVLDNMNEYKEKFGSYSNEFGRLEEYQELLSDVGRLEMEREVADAALGVACDLLGLGLDEACRAAEFAANVAMVGVTSLKIKKLVENTGALKLTRDIALMSAVTHMDTIRVDGLHGAQYNEIVPDIEKMLFSVPKLSISSVRSDTAVVPLMLSDECESNDLFDWNSFSENCSDSTGKTLEVTAIAFKDFNEPLPTRQSILPMTIKDVHAENGGRLVTYGNIDFFSTDKFIKEFRFQVDDFEPDSIRWLKLDFNTRVQIVYERIGRSEWNVYFEQNYKQETSPVAVLHESPIKRNGLFIFRPGDIVDAYNEMNQEKSIELNAIMSDGSNVVFATLMNKVGNQASSRFSFFRMSTDFIGNEIWPKGFAELSVLDEVKAFFSNHAYDIATLKDAVLRIGKVGPDGVDSTSLDSVRVSPVPVACPSGTEGESCWTVSARLDTVLSASLQDGEYLVSWDFVVDVDGATEDRHYNLNTYVHMDKSAPSLKLQVPNRSVTGTVKDGVWANVRDTLQGEAVRAMHGWLLNKVSGQVFDLFYKAHHNSEFYDVRWNGNLPVEGRYGLMVQAYDFAVPDSVLDDTLQTVAADSGRSSWSQVLEDGFSFRDGINGLTLQEDVWIDRTAAYVVDGSVKVSTKADSVNFGCLDSTKYEKDRGFMVNSCNLLSVSFRLHEDLMERGSSDLKVDVVLVDSAGAKEVFRRSFYEVVTMDASEKDFVFEEPSASRLKDGVYSMFVQLTDEAGNVSEEEVVDRILVDRTSPGVDLRAGGQFFTSVSYLKDATASLQQNRDDPRLISKLSCYRKLVAPGRTFDWEFIRSDAASANSAYDFVFTVSDWAASWDVSGKWFVHAMCYDVAGNPGYAVDDFGIGARYPEITYPNDSLNILYYGKVLVKGKTPNPVVDGNSNALKFKLEWKSYSEDGWHEDGFEPLAQTASGDDNELAVWNIPDSAQGLYALKLSVKGCESCEWVSTETEVPIYSRIDFEHVDPAAEIAMKLPSRQVPGVPDSILLELKNSNDTTAWKLDAKIYVRSQRDTSLVEAKTYEFQRATVSPFSGSPSAIDSGLYIWQEGRVWNVLWKGTARGRTLVSNPLQRVSPVLSLKYVDTNVVFVDGVVGKLDSANAPSIVVDSAGLSVPAFDRVLSVNLDSLEDGLLHLVFETDDAFIIDVSTLEGVDTIAFCGADMRRASDVLPFFAGIGTAYVHPEQYRMTLYWNGETRTGLVPGGDTVFAKVIAYSRAKPERMICADTSWLVVRASEPSVAFDTLAYAPADLYSPNSEGSKTMFAYGVLGRGAPVREEVLDSEGNVVVTLSSGSEFAVAGSSDKARSAVWDGTLADDRMAPLGKYRFRVSVLDDSGNVVNSVESKDFRILDGRNLLVAEEGAVEFEIDEALMDEFGDLRYVGSLDYLMRTRASANYLPEEWRTFNYKWQMDPKAVQAPALYNKYRFSLGLHRHRSRFPVTVAVLVATEGYNLRSTFGYCSADKHHHFPYVIKIMKMDMDENFEASMDVSLSSSYEIVGYDINGDGILPYGIVMGVKVMPAGVFKNIVENLENLPKNVFNSSEFDDVNKKYVLMGDAQVDKYGVDTLIYSGGFGLVPQKDTAYIPNGAFDMEMVWPDLCGEQKCIVDSLKMYYGKNTFMNQWFESFSQPVLWETGKYEFLEASAPFEINEGLAKIESFEQTCIPDTSENELDSLYVCGPRNAIQASDSLTLVRSNAEIDMLKIGVGYGFESGFSNKNVDAEFGCGEHDGASSEVKLKLTFSVKPDYWNPRWGYNNLANSYLRFDPTNTDLYGDDGYFAANLGSSRAAGALDDSYRNFFGENGWEFSSSKEDAMLTAFEAQRFSIRQNPSSPLLFGDELTSDSANFYESYFDWRYFGNPQAKFVATATRRSAEGAELSRLYSHAQFNSSKDSLVSKTPINPLDLTISVAPVVSPYDAFVQDVRNFSLPYPYSGDVDALDIDSVQHKENFKFYTSARSRIHLGVDDWDDSWWDSLYVYPQSNVMRNPLTDPSLNSPTATVSRTAVPNVGSLLDTSFTYKLEPGDYVESADGPDLGRWVVPQDSIHGVSLSSPKYGSSNGMPGTDMKLVRLDSDGNVAKESEFCRIGRDDVSSKWTVEFTGVARSSDFDYIYSMGPVKRNEGNPSHAVPVDSVISQNMNDTTLKMSDSLWMRNLTFALDGIYERDTNTVDSLLKKHPFLLAEYDSQNGMFNVTWNGKAPTERVSEVATFRGRVPGADAFWRVAYADGDGIHQTLAEGIQDVEPDSGLLPILARADISTLQGETAFYLMYGNPEGVMRQKSVVVRIGTRVDPDSAARVWDKYAKASVDFVAGAWGSDAIDVTLRTVSANEKIYESFGNLDIVGPVVEILPSHKFPADDVASWPLVTFRLTREDVDSLPVADLKIYKPNAETGTIDPLEMRERTCYATDYTKTQGDLAVDCNGDTWDYVVLKAQTASFSSFIVLDSNYAKTLVPTDTLPGDVDTLRCVEPSADTVWAGTFNGRLDLASPCSGRGNYLLQLRSGSAVAAEHQGVFSDRIAWEARNRDLWIGAEVYSSRMDFYGVDGSTEQVRGPFVRIDSIAPTIDDVETSISEDGGDKMLNVSALIADSGSGIASVTMNVYFGKDLVETKNVPFGESVKDTSVSEDFRINGKLLRECIGCHASVEIVVDDFGYNHAEERFRSELIYPYPMSLVLWYPFSEGFGDQAREMTGTGLHLNLGNVSSPWMYGGKINFAGFKDYATSSGYLEREEETPFSVEFRGVVGIREGSLLSDLVARWKIYVENHSLFVDCGGEKVRLSAPLGTNVLRHYVFVFDESSLSLYVDGGFVERVNLPREVSMGESFKLYLGSSAGSSFFRMSDLRVYKSALTVEQIRDLYHYEYVPDEESEKVIVVRAADVEDHDGLVIDQSCALPGKAYLRQKNSASEGWVNWTVDAEAGDYALYLLMRGYTTETSLVEVSVNNVNYGIHRLRSSGLWESVRVGDSLKFNLVNGENVVSVRPVGNVGVAGLAVVSSLRDFDMEKLDFGQADWNEPEPRVEVRLMYDDYRDTTWARPHLKFRNLTAKSFPNARLRYFYKGEGSSVRAQGFWPNLPMSVVSDAGEVYYAELALNEPIAPYAGAYGDEGVKLGLYRLPNNRRWNIFDDPSYASGSENGYVVANGIALLDDNGELLNEWQCYDDGLPAEQAKPSVRALAKDESENSSQSSRVRVVVENDGSVAVDGFEVRYYYRDADGKMAKPDYYDFAFADTSYMNVGGNLYYVSFMYRNSVLNSGERNAYGNGAQFALHGKDWNPAYFDASDDPSHRGLGREFAVADSIVVLDGNGNLLWGHVPQPKFANNFVVMPAGESRVTRVGDVVYVDIDETGYYTLETVNAVGTPLARLFDGTWQPGEHMVQIPADKLNAGGYLVLRMGNIILNWQLLK